ncbi:hypothetical protein BOTBODRAFT_53604 [Botryobasidium botryosum FD-172 SS1]|uniref:choline-phosphate cytidylyltransferase n=1 Tax=Botryobasidium botryosum (strain FD-172 SS1) TaxID=930990 RepID=A0A067MN38_BOTB1|nr:hypothetical protein BOTBODRAFT_53604 [Botryobasidium botryosum FD-172 SS1]
MVQRDENSANPAEWTAEEIQAYTRRVIDGLERKPYKLNEPPEDRPVRIYSDGVYDMFHYGHALQLRQAKLSFPSVHLVVGVCRDDVVERHKATRPVMSMTERCEALRHCRWVDEVIPDAPWILTDEFVREWEIDYVAHDDEPYPGIDGTEDVFGFLKKQGKLLPTRRTPGVSTTEILGRVVERYRRGDLDRKLEKIGRSELISRFYSRGRRSWLW